uniref:Integrase catalytic domain-containing protein n=1 Tax=Tanacetum cinerariifolium TaxID=118510 RepID=A0A6L2M5P3_TANCI|nr:hypothetical protein [Tanacetum cinerariifolium]
MLLELKTLFAQQAEQELLQTTRDFHSCKQEEGQSVSSYVLKIKGYIDNLERLGHPVTLGLGVSLILVGLCKEFNGFVHNYNMHSLGKTINELHVMLKLHEQTLPKNNTPALHAIRAGKVQKVNKHKKSQPQMAARGQNHRKGKNKLAYAPKPKILPPPKREDPAKDSICHECEPYTHQVERAKDLLGLIHTDVCGPFKIMSRQGANYFVTFIDDFSRYGYVYLLKHKHEVFETFKVFQKEVENQLSKTIKSLRLDREGEYISQEFLDHLKDHGIIAHRTPPYTPQHNGVSERRNITLLDMVRSMISQTTLSKSFWDYALETAARILNMVPTKKVEKTPYEVWHGQAPKPSYLKVWGYEALVKRDTLTKPDKLKTMSIKCIFIGYLKKTMGYSFYYPPKNKVLVARNAEFLENSLITQEASGSLEELEIIQEEDTHPSIDTSLNHEPDDLEIDEPQSDIIPIRRSTRTRHLTDRMCLYIDAEEHELGDLGEPINYKAALLDPESDKWLNAMNVEIQSMKDNKVLVLVELPPNGKSVSSKWIFKKKTDMNGAVHTYKARLVANGYTQTLGIDYEETFSPVADIRAIRILIPIVAYYDYEIWHMDVKTAFLNGYLSEKVYMEQPEGFFNPEKYFAKKDLGQAAYILGIKIYIDRSRRLIGLCQSAYIEKILKRNHMENSKRGNIPMQDKLKLSKSQGASTPAELKRMQNVSYASVVGSIMVSCYTDAGYLTDADDLKSQIRYMFVLNSGVVDWKNAKQIIFTTSSVEAKYIAAFDASKEAVWVRKFISGLDVVLTIEEPISMYCDNTGAIAIANESGITKGTRHFHAKVNYLREVIEYGDVKLEKVHTYDNLTDPFTKALAFLKHSEHTRNIEMLTVSSLM